MSDPAPHPAPHTVPSHPRVGRPRATPSTSPRASPGAGRVVALRGRRPNGDDSFFGAQPTTRTQLPDPEPLLLNLTRCIIEVLAGARELDQLARWITDDVYRHLLKRVVLASRARQVKGRPAYRPQFSLGHASIHEPSDGVVEAVIMVHQRTRARAVAIRLEGLDNRWRASAINVL